MSYYYLFWSIFYAIIFNSVFQSISATKGINHRVEGITNLPLNSEALKDIWDYYSDDIIGTVIYDSNPSQLGLVIDKTSKYEKYEYSKVELEVAWILRQDENNAKKYLERKDKNGLFDAYSFESITAEFVRLDNGHIKDSRTGEFNEVAKEIYKNDKIFVINNRTANLIRNKENSVLKLQKQRFPLKYGSPEQEELEKELKKKNNKREPIIGGFPDKMEEYLQQLEENNEPY